VYRDPPKPETGEVEVQTDKVQEAPPPDGMLDKLANVASAAGAEHDKHMQIVSRLETDIKDLKEELANAMKKVKAAESADGPVKIVEVIKEAPKPEVAMKETQTAPMEVVTQTVQAKPGSSELEQALEIKVRDEKIQEIQQAHEATMAAKKKVEDEKLLLKKELEDLQEWIKNQPVPEAAAPAEVAVQREQKPRGPSQEDLDKTAKIEAKLRKDNRQLGDDLEQQREMNTKLEVAISELRDKLMTLQDQLRSAGMGEIADRMFDSAGLSEILSSKPLTVFDRLYNDALKRVRRQAGYQTVTKSQHAEALLETIHHIDNPPPVRNELPSQSSQPLMRAPMQPPSSPLQQLQQQQQYAPQQYAPQQYAPQQQQQQQPQRIAPLRSVSSLTSEQPQYTPVANPFIVQRYDHYAGGIAPPIQLQPVQIGRTLTADRPETPQKGSIRAPSPKSRQNTMELGGHEVIGSSLEPKGEAHPETRECSTTKDDMRVGSRVRAIEGSQFKVGARTVQVQKGALGTVVQLYPNIGVDWDCLPACDKLFMQSDMIECVDMQGGQDRPASVSEAARSTALPPASPLGTMRPTALNAMSPQASYPNASLSSPGIFSPGAQMLQQMMSNTLPGPGTRLPQMGAEQRNAQQGLSKSASMPNLGMDRSSSPSKTLPNSPSKRLPRLDSPGMNKRNPESPMLGGELGARPASMGSNGIFYKQNGAGDNLMNKSSNQLRANQRSGTTPNLGGRSPSQPQGSVKLGIQGTMVEAPPVAAIR